jgi:hypothetical protein
MAEKKRRTGLGIQTRTGAYGHMLSVNVSEGMANELKAYADETNASSMAAAVRQLLVSGLERYRQAEAKYFRPETGEL